MKKFVFVKTSYGEVIALQKEIATPALLETLGYKLFRGKLSVEERLRLKAEAVYGVHD